MIITPSEVHDAIIKLGDNKACGMDNITAEHMKLVPAIKDKVGKLNSSENYRPIALASILFKVLEMILMSRLERYILTADNQFGFKHKHSTDMCIFALREILDNYNRQNTTMFLGCIDASKAFDRVNHEKMLKKLCERGVPRYLVRILSFW